ncbi:VOC family protein [Kytococcus sp. HMSC28H12]|uniref:VOC family protein n=1 Tax=Kytococcus sp. HMSC28H12 TaxID=1581067 RepID=UPI00114CFAE1|nr:VOC family protein [Kytococcus sp. HMSC28H12]
MTIVEQPWPTGVPCWVDCQVDDVPAAVDFYRAVFGWEIEQERLTGEGHEFHIAWQDGRPVAGIGPKATGDVVPPSGWLTYFSCTDVDRAVAATTRLGGTVFYDPVDLVDACRLCCAVDPKGTAFGLWEARRSPGYRSMGGVGTVVWHELHTRRFRTQHDFYAAVLDLDWTSDGAATSPT